jgi:hypothetical protein
MASVCGDVVIRLDQLCEHLPTWVSADQLTALVAHYRDLATEHRDAADRQRERGALDAFQFSTYGNSTSPWPGWVLTPQHSLSVPLPELPAQRAIVSPD